MSAIKTYLVRMIVRDDDSPESEQEATVRARNTHLCKRIVLDLCHQRHILVSEFVSIIEMKEAKG